MLIISGLARVSDGETEKEAGGIIVTMTGTTTRTTPRDNVSTHAVSSLMTTLWDDVTSL